MRGMLSSMMFWIGVAIAAWFLIPGLSDRTKELLRPKPALPEFTVRDCRDICDQKAILNQTTVAQLDRCRTNCDERFKVTLPYDPIQQVTRAPADHGAAPPTGRIIPGPVRR